MGVVSFLGGVSTLIKRMPFGKHQGIKMEDVPIDYLNWLSTTDLDEDLDYTVNHLLNKISKGYA